MSFFINHVESNEPELKDVLLISGAELEKTGQEVENLRKEVDKLKHCGEWDYG